MEQPDLLVIGAGVVGLSAARVFVMRHPGAHAVVIDKERALGAHASGRNSGVLHAGFYYAADSLKARLCRDGNRAWRSFCAEHGVDVRGCGKLVVATDPSQLPALDALYHRGIAGGVRLERVTEDEARRIEPRATTIDRALWSPDTAVLDPHAALSALAADAVARGVQLRMGVRFLGGSIARIETSEGPYAPGRLLNCAGVYADRVAAHFGAGERYQLVPFAGRYLWGEPEAKPLSVCIYPVPDPQMPFLGVHLTVRSDGGLKIGPTAQPARWREDYGGLSSLSLRELGEQGIAQLRLFAHSPIFRRHALREARRYSRRAMLAEARRLASGLSPEQFVRWGKTGIRAQLVSRDSGELVSDFVIEESQRSLHVLNAVSPAFTAALPFAELLSERLEGDLGGT